ncbi:phospho-sugar mutase [Tuwongella immobilis]|uniref:Alpha-D-phosphohexomutase alpha/beta/alpha domain-containing protein n=1 Tax=Tuwongella immobilis TaxID=692036 RepID=A0A6C2YRD7_9BACT|nr:phospho-sugar mutase [Tuwongella immobilis]VIP04220.1 phosphomannomutase : Uncharacterized protein OS=Candidatus Entotheonella sp. TSY2 GN=ETSY2_36385 PE=4 SV=1: PGM_PMM_I: PGM_PMM_II: PGM_PMM_III [Tuwongella immobilis]VTS05804.1 phosphomannomutase : Uncharacterized protein OS=Candidatus Entotheonella sp. TSY2 GN=ETSY2_36385 PE=4 SV=1: PGM_PMM_I: PGM_PMM_II: PGM_PMM_III [Tuwongella immobilis]
MDWKSKVQAGFETVDADPAFKQRAIQNLEQWLTDPDTAAYRPQIDWLIEQGRYSDLLDAFYQVLPFGTGGRRGAVGIGPNRMNLWTLNASVQGHVDYLKQKFPNVSELHVVLAYDVRQFEDQRKVYNPALPNPVLHLSSKEFVHSAACVYVANGVHVHVLPADSQRYLATPELSYSIRHLKAHGGLNISASHNPPDDNGGKFYDERGGQPVPPDDQIMSDMVDQVTSVRIIPWADAVRSGKIHWLESSVHDAYIEICRKQTLVPPPRFDEIKVVFTPLHGVGSMTAMETLIAQGFRPIPVPEQMAADGQFPNVTGTPNPELPVSFDRAVVVAKEQQAHLILSTDPDADRIGCMACETLDGPSEFRYINGNEIAMLLTYFKLAKLTEQNRLPKSPVVVKTEVTSNIVTRVARHFGSQVIDNLLVGFKYIAEVLWQLESTGTYEEVKATLDDYVIGVEESHGAMLMATVRDKDASAAALLLAELALDLKRQGQTVVQLLDRLAKQFGYFRNDGINIVMTGIEGKSNMIKMLDTLRNNPPAQIGAWKVESFEDLRNEDGRMGPLKGATDAASRNFLIFRLAANTSGKLPLSARVVLRPSGTEPKAKAYVEVGCDPYTNHLSDAEWNAIRADVDAHVKAIGKAFVAMAMGTVGLTPPA